MNAILPAAVFALFFADPAAKTDEPASPAAVDVSKLEGVTLDPAAIVLDDPRFMQRILASGRVAGRAVDVTDLTRLESSNPKVVVLNDRKEAVPVADGEAEIIARVGAHEARAKVQVKNAASGRPVNFPNEIVPVFSKLTCNSGGCHGKSGGQNGFALSLLGFAPSDDYDYLVKEGRGRRIFPAAPEQSLLLRKATGVLPHGGGKLMKIGDDNFQLLVAWIKQGMPYGSENERKVRAISIHPPERVMNREAVQRLRVAATFEDGRVEDVTRFVQFQSNDDSVASVDESGKVETHDLAGESAIMARYQGQVAVFRVTVPLNVKIENPPAFVARNYIDERTSKKWKDLGLVPSEQASDFQILRRLYLDLCGKLPPLDVVQRFVSDADPQKRDKLIDELLASADYAGFMAMKWGAILQNKRIGKEEYAPGTHAMSLWLRHAMHTDMPYDKFVRSILTASGSPETNPPVVWYRVVRTNEDNVDNVSQLFLGTRIQCARCHHHPFEKWGQEDYYGMAAFFSRIGRKHFGNAPNGQPNEAVFVARAGGVHHPRTGQPVPPRGLGAPPVDVPPGEDPRARLVDWMTRPDNPYFAKALVNRLWGHFFGRGLVEPIDDMRVTNPPVNPELLEALAEDFIKFGYRIKHIVRAICRSSTYQLSSEPNDYNIHDKQNFARYYPKRLPAEVLLDALDTVTAVPTSFGFPAEMRAVDLPDEQVGSYFLDVFGRPQRTSSCECERSGEANLSQALHLLNSNDVHSKLIADAGRAAQLAADKRPDAEKVAELFHLFFTRPPREVELRTALEHLASKEDKRAAWQNLIWALLNTKEFQFNT